MALAILTMFVAYLRPSEALKLRGADIVPPSGSHREVAINLFPSERSDRSKTMVSDPSLLLDAPYAPWLGPALLKIAKNQKEFRIFPFSHLQIADAFREAQAKMGLENEFILYQLRHGGPSHDRAMQIRTLPEVKQRGAWASDASVKRYEGHARLQQVEARLPQAWKAKIKTAPRQVGALIRSAMKEWNASAYSSSSLVPETFHKRSPTLAGRTKPGMSSTTGAMTSRKRTMCDDYYEISAEAATHASGLASPAAHGRELEDETVLAPRRSAQTSASMALRISDRTTPAKSARPIVCYE